MLKFSRIALGRLCLAAFALVAASAASRWAPDPSFRGGAFERSATRLTTDLGEVWEKNGEFDDVENVGMVKIGVLGAWRESGDRRVVERLRADFDERLCVGATDFWASRRCESGAEVALRAVADGWARWSVGPAATARFLETLTATERAAFERLRRSREAFDFAAERTASAEASQEASTALIALKSEDGENDAKFNDGVDAALTFLRSFDSTEDASSDGCDDINIKGERGEPFLWAAAFDGNPLNAVGAFALADVVAVEDAAVERARRAFAASATLFFLSTFGAFGGVFPRAWGAILNVGGDNRLEREFWRRLDAAFRRLGVAAERLRLFFYFARLALFNAFRRFDVEDGSASKRALVVLCASTRLLN